MAGQGRWLGGECIVHVCAKGLDTCEYANILWVVKSDDNVCNSLIYSDGNIFKCTLWHMHLFVCYGMCSLFVCSMYIHARPALGAQSSTVGQEAEGRM